MRFFEKLSQVIKTLSNAVDAKDRYTSGHSLRVAEYSKMLARRMGKSKTEQTEIYYAGLLHDIGMIRVPDKIINKPEKLTPKEFDFIKLHPIAGYHILKDLSDSPLLAYAAKYHHERYDGSGYPNGLAGENIPEVARIIAVADAYDAMTSDRSYRVMFSQEFVRCEIEDGIGTQFDPQIASYMLELIDEDKDFRMRQFFSLDRTILAVDDEPVNLTLIRKALKDNPYFTILDATDGMSALEILKNTAVDLVLLDIEMPGLNGFKVIEKLRKFSNVPVVFMTASKVLGDIQKAGRFGVEDYITKPFLPAALLEVIYDAAKTKHDEQGVLIK